MLIRCPTCASGYDLDPGMVPEGRILRCAHCRDAWVHVRAVEGSDEHDLRTEARFGASGAAQERRPRSTGVRTRRFAGAAAGVLLAAIAAGSAAAVAEKARVVVACPPTAAVFAALGLPVNLVGLALGDVRSAVETGDGPSILTLEGRITNLRGAPTEVPDLRIAVRDANRRELYYWTAPAPKANLAAGESVPFRSRLTAPPTDGQDLAVSFAVPAAAPRRVAELAPTER